jgi:hypothetical protein
MPGCWYIAMRLRPLIALLAALATFAAAPVAAGAAVPQGFAGVNLGGPFFYPDFDQNGQLNEMVSSGVESVRSLFDWAQMQPYASFNRVPSNIRGEFTNVGGVPTNFGVTDNLVRLAALHRLTILAQIEYAPAWDSRNPRSQASPPKSPGPYAKFVAALARRYGSHGTFWTLNPGIPKTPIRLWQIWNEPNFRAYWSQQPWEPGYLKLIRATRSAVKAVDPSAKIVLAGLANFSWQYLSQVYKTFGPQRRLFDVVAIHPFTATPAGVITILKRVRTLMNQRGDRNKPIIADELSWPSAQGKAKATFENATSEQGQAQKTAQAIRLLARDRKQLKLIGFYYFAWIGNETMPGARNDQFNFAGLVRFINGVGVQVKPALRAFTEAALSVEGCRSKSSVATNCTR